MSKVAALINPRSGSVPANADALLDAALAELGESCDIHMLDTEDLVDAVEGCIASDPEMVIVWSGDGTVACALEKAGADGPPILPLPGGTMNLFHKQIHGGACEWQDCLRDGLTRGKLIDVPAGRAGDRLFFVAAMAGNLTDLAGPREALREGKVIAAIEKLAGADLFDFTHAMKFSTRTQPEAGTATAAAIFVGTQADKDFEFAFIDPDNPLELAAAGIGALVADWREAQGVTILRDTEVILEDPKGLDLRTTLDGEPIRLPSGTRFSRIAKAGRAISANYE